MKASIIASTLAIFGSALAFPTAPQTQTQTLFTIQLTNDFSGANAIRSVAVNNTPTTFSTLFTGTILVKNGAVIATSVQNVNPQGNAQCVIKNAVGAEVGRINNQKTFLDLDGDVTKAVETDVSAFTITCF
ncbi:hypothetical protein BU25DRAFT_424541 [Macroventuria anomochaeta]|uniref:Uncharacterized protein n=1 Tax=Macroventuria anomochaeta TaxID=301207 RepID=A0ACB6RRG7_9PLEO|nr:uncharacterized protein BU25DRAFT_424541 [Macroventuria anomochaeta]KAF2623862.1 hypothetical protein BU25DRAFT_424541 [Macroventuria anomochaeta]